MGLQGSAHLNFSLLRYPFNEYHGTRLTIVQLLNLATCCFSYC